MSAGIWNHRIVTFDVFKYSYVEGVQDAGQK